MRFATCIFLLAVIILGAFAFGGYLLDSYQHAFDENMKQKEAIEDLKNRLNAQDARNKELENRVFQDQQRLDDLQKKLEEQTAIAKQYQTALEQSLINEAEYRNSIEVLQNEKKNIQGELDKTKNDLQNTIISLRQAITQKEQMGAILQQTVDDRNQYAEKVKKLQDATSFTSFVLQNGFIPTGMLSVAVVFGFVFWKSKNLKVWLYQTRAPSTRPSKTHQRQFKVVMNEPTYQKFQEYLRGK